MNGQQALQAPRPKAPQHGDRHLEPGPRAAITPEIYRLPEVVAICGISRSTIYEMIHRDEFPAQVRLGARAVGWRRSDIEAWLASRPAA
ncbi:MAG: AlpA family transcriptional regulator [bacterium]|nr:AlpA family transcriptional regulator [bacterium]